MKEAHFVHVEKFPGFLLLSVTVVLSSSASGSLSHYCRAPPSAPHKSQPLWADELPTTGEPGVQGLAGDTE